MPTSKVVDLDETSKSKKSGTIMRGSRRSARLRKPALDVTAEGEDPDETVLDESKCLLSEEEDGDAGDAGGEGRADAMDMDDDQFAVVDGLKGDSPPLIIRGGARGAGLTNDPLTSSTLKSSQSTTFSQLRRNIGRDNKKGAAKAKKANNSRVNNPKAAAPTKKKDISNSAAWGDDSDDSDLSDEEFRREVTRRNAENQARLEREEESQPKQSSDSSLEPSLRTQPQQSNNESEDTARMGNRGAAPKDGPSLSDEFAATQDWEKEVGDLPDAPAKDVRQKEDSMEVDRQEEQAKPAASKSSSRRSQGAPRKEDPRKDQHSMEVDRPEDQAQRAASKRSSSRSQGAPRKEDPRRDERRETGMDVSPKRASKKEQRAEAKARAKAWHDSRGGAARETQASAPDLDASAVQENDPRREEQRPIDPRKPAPSNRMPSNRHKDWRDRDSGQEHQQRQSHQQNVPRQDHRRRAQLMQEQLEEQYDNSDNLGGYQPSDHRRQERPERQRDDEGLYNPPFHSRNQGAGAASNPYQRRQPPPPSKRVSINVPKIALEHLKSARKSRKGHSRIDRSHDNMSLDTSADDDETWQEETFRSSLLDLLGSFPSSYFDSHESGTEESQCSLFATSATENDADDHSPHSTTSQSAASAQLQRKRLFDDASRFLARLAIASRHPSTKGDGSRTDRSSDGARPPDFDPPSPRSLPSYLSVLNVHEDADRYGGQWGGNANAMLSSSKEVFSGRSVHGRNARTVRLSTVREGNGVPSSNPFAPWTLEELAYGAMVLAAQVCFEASCDPNFDGNTATGEAESCRVAGFAQNSRRAGDRGKKPIVSAALVESSLGFLATSFGCLEADFVHAVMKSALKAGDSDATVFDAVSHFAPVSSESVGTISSLSLLALSRGLEAALYVARYATSLDPSSACVAYTSPHNSCGATISCSVDTGIDEGGVGWLSALGRDLGLKLEDARTSGSRHFHLRAIAAQAYDFILDFSPTIVEDAPRRNGRESQRRGNSRGGLNVDTQVDQGTQGLGAVCHQSSVANDRLYAANVEYLSSMIQAGLVSGWLSSDSSSDGDGTDESKEARTAEKLVQKLFNVIETRARLRRSTNQNTSSSDHGDSEAVCAASLSLVILALPKHANNTAPSSLSTSFRQMGTSSATVEDVLQSPLVRNLVEMALSWQDASGVQGRDAAMNSRATSNAIYVLSDICTAGGSSLIASQFQASVDHFLRDVTEAICQRGKAGAGGESCEDASLEPPLMLLLQFHMGSPVLVRRFLRGIIEQSSDRDDDSAPCFANGLLKLSVSQSFSTSSCTSSLLRALIDGNPADRAQDRLSDHILSSLDTEQVGASIESALRALVEAAYSTVHCNAPAFSSRWHPRLCCLGDLLGGCIHSFTAAEIFASSLSDEALSLFANAIGRQDKDTLAGAAILSILGLFASFVSFDCQNEQPILAQQRDVKGKLLRSSSFLPALEFAMGQGSSADLTHRSLRLQNALASLIDERSFALTFTKASDSVARKGGILLGKLAKSEAELSDITSRYREMESDHDALTSALHDQRLEYERQLEWTRSEARMSARGVSEIHVQERRQAEEQYAEEKERRETAEHENDQLQHESTSDKSRIKELEALLAQERKSRQHFESALEDCQNELATTSEELEKTSNAHDVLEEKLAVAEETVSDLTERYEDAQECLEEDCSKLVRLAAIYQRREAEMDKHKAELRVAVTNANNRADTANEKYERAKEQHKLLKVELKEATSELKELKANKADVQRMRKNAPVAYLNQVVRGEKPKSRKARVLCRSVAYFDACTHPFDVTDSNPTRGYYAKIDAFCDKALITQGQYFLTGFLNIVVQVELSYAEHGEKVPVLVASLPAYKHLFDCIPAGTATALLLLCGNVPHPQRFLMEVTKALTPEEKDLLNRILSTFFRLIPEVRLTGDGMTSILDKWGGEMTPEEYAELESLKQAGRIKGGQTIADACQRWQEHLQGRLAGEELSEKEIRIATAVLDALARGRETTGAAEAAVRANDASSTQLSIVQRRREGAATGRATQAAGGHEGLGRGRTTQAVGGHEGLRRGRTTQAARGHEGLRRGRETSLDTRAAGGFQSLARGRATQAANGRSTAANGHSTATHDAKWEAKYALLRQFTTKHGHTRVTKSYDASLHSWVINQRSKRKGTTSGRLTDEQIRRLNEIGFVWDASSFEGGILSDRTIHIEAVVLENCDNDEEKMRRFVNDCIAGTLMNDFPGLKQYSYTEVEASLCTIKKRLAKRGANESNE